MRPYFLVLSLGLFAGIQSVSAQGLLSLQNSADFKEKTPLTFSIGASGGYDSLNYKNSNINDIDSYFVQGSVGASYSSNDKITPWNLGLDIGVLQYLDHTPGQKDTNYSDRLVFNISHQFSPRLSVTDNFYVTYEAEPNFGIGASTASRNGQYFYGYNNFAVAYAWSERFSTTTSYTVDAIKYQDSAIGDFEDRVSHLFSQAFSWAWTHTTKVVGEYRFRTTQYQRSSSDYMSHYVLAGIDKAWSERTTGSFRAGAEFYSNDRVDKTAPYFEASLNYAVSKKTTATVYSSVGFDGSELGNSDSRYSYRVGASATHRLTDRLSLNADANYVYSTLSSSGAPDFTEHEISASAGIGYRFWDNVSVNANYSYSVLSSDDAQRDYDRNRISVGVNATF